jgi:hypothetical protein
MPRRAGEPRAHARPRATGERAGAVRVWRQRDCLVRSPGELGPRAPHRPGWRRVGRKPYRTRLKQGCRSAPHRPGWWSSRSTRCPPWRSAGRPGRPGSPRRCAPAAAPADPLSGPFHALQVVLMQSTIRGFPAPARQAACARERREGRLRGAGGRHGGAAAARGARAAAAPRAPCRPPRRASAPRWPCLRERRCHRQRVVPVAHSRHNGLKQQSARAPNTRHLRQPARNGCAGRWRLAPSAASTRAALLLVRRSSWCRLRSSTTALMAATPSTNSSDSVGPYGANGLTTAHHARLACARPAAGAAAKLVQVRCLSRAAGLETPVHVQHARFVNSSVGHGVLRPFG